MKNNHKIALFAIILGLFVVRDAFGAEFLAPTHNSDQNISVPASAVKKNLYTSGASVTLNGDILGDVYVAGGTVSLVGNVEQDANIIGGSLSLVGNIGGDTRVAGGNIHITGTIGGDLLLAGGNVTISEKSSIGGDLVAGVGNLIIDAPVTGDLKIAGGNITINSKISGNVLVANNQSLNFGPRAEVMGKITHKGQKEAVVKEGAKISAIDFEKVLSKEKGSKIFSFGGFLVQIVALFIASWLLLRFRKKSLMELADIVKMSPWGSLGIGLTCLILTPVVIALLLLSVVGYYLAILLFFTYVLVLLWACVIATVILGNYIMQKVFKKADAEAWKISLLGVVCWKVLSIVPVLGWLLVFGLFVIVLGGSFKIIKQKFIQN